MKFATTTTFLMLLACAVFAQNIQNERKTKWPASYLTNIKISNQTVVPISHLGADKTGLQSIDALLQSVIEELSPTGGVIYLSEGSYLVRQTIILPSNIYLIGDGSAKTTLILDMGGVGHGISATGHTMGSWQLLKQNALKGSSQIEVETSTFKKGDLVRIRISDKSKTTSSWANGTVGQITEVVDVTGNTLTLKDALRLDLNVSQQAEVVKINPVENSGILNLSIIRKDKTASQTDNIHFEYTRNALVYGVESSFCNYSHVNNVYTYATYVYGSSFKEAFDFGSGGKAYGVVLSFTSSQGIVENNIFEKLRHSVLFQAGPNGNVIGYNYSVHPYWTGVAFPSDFAGDIVMHGNYPFMNLVEGNIIQNLVIDNSHGINGPNNTFLRNRVEHAGIFMNDQPASDAQIFIGNEVTGTGTSSNGYISFPKGLYALAGKNHIEFANNVNGTYFPTEVKVDDLSYYHMQKPPFFKEAIWPSVGYPNALNAQQIPAFRRHKLNVKTISYPFQNPYKDDIFNFSVDANAHGAQLSWNVSSTEVCQQFKIYRFTDVQHTGEMANLNCGEAQEADFFSFQDFTFDAIDASYAGYFVIMTTVSGKDIESDTVYLSTQVSVGLPANLVFKNPLRSWLYIDLMDQKGQLISREENISSFNGTVAQGIYYAKYVGVQGDLSIQKIFVANP